MYFVFKSRFFYLSYVFLLSDVMYAAGLQSVRRIAVVGSGIGGSSCAYFLNELLGKENVTIDVFEANKVGGRLSLVKINDASFESGGSIIHPRNRYMKDFVDSFGLKAKTAVTLSRVGLYDGKDFLFTESNWEFITYVKMLWRYGTDLFKLRSYISSLLDYFDNIYTLQRKYQSFETVSDLLNAMNSEFSVYLTRSVADGFKKEMKYNDKLVDELIFSANRVNYGQTNSIHQFVGSVSVAGAMNGLWAVEGGNYQVAEKLLENSKADFINNKVETVEYVEDSENFNVITNNNISQTYDVLILAAPATNDAILPIKFVNFPDKFRIPGSYHHTICTFVEGQINNEYFGYSTPDDVPGSIFSLNKNIFFNSISLLNASGKNSVYKVFSQSVLTDEQLKLLFKEKLSIEVIDWAAYPEYQTVPRNDSFILFKNLYYVNAIEWAASAMEMSVIGAKNVALLVYNNLVDSKNGNVCKDEL